MDALNALPKLLGSKVVDEGTPEDFLTLATGILGLSRRIIQCDQEVLPSDLGDGYAGFFRKICNDPKVPRMVAGASIVAVISHKRQLILAALEAAPEMVRALLNTLELCLHLGLEYAAPLLLALEGVTYYDAGKELVLREGGVATLSKFIVNASEKDDFSHSLRKTALETLSNATIPSDSLKQLAMEDEMLDKFVKLIISSVGPPSSLSLVHATLGVILNITRDSGIRSKLISNGATDMITKCLSISDASILKLALTALFSISRDDPSTRDRASRTEINKSLGKALASYMLLDITDEILGRDTFDEQALISSANTTRFDCECDLNELLRPHEKGSKYE